MRLTCQEQLDREIVKYRKARNKLAVLYYCQRYTSLACVSWETFSKSWAGEKWIKENGDKV